MTKEGIQNPRYKGFYTKEERDKALELNSIDPEIINNALNPEPEVVIINSGFTKTSKSYKVTIIHLPMDLEFKTFLGIQKFLFKCHQESQKSPVVPGLYIKAHPYFNQRFGCTKSSPMCHPPFKNCPCKIKFLIRKAQIDLEQFKPIIYEDVPVNLKTLFDYGCLASVHIPPTEKFSFFAPSINEVLNTL
ncbi:hypothetical protein Fmac_020017 [Flemingia macrophylla]|uniref:Uncharacterized protein n=1 Tax=Flemingia macrophylla TaxID=520843 RepID=A0ABD1M9G6_9FABA